MLKDWTFWAFIFRWLHVISGIMWIGHLWYFNFTQAPTITKHILPEALFWFRWGAMATLITGIATILALYGWKSGLLPAIEIGIASGMPKFTAIGIGMWLGTIMWFNVWFIIWPNQKKVIGITPAGDDEKKAAARTASLTSRVNTLLSFPMLYCMTSVHFYWDTSLPFDSSNGAARPRFVWA
jgi:uncharacterized membrane protein